MEQDFIDRQNNLVLCAQTDLSRLISLFCTQAVLPVALSRTFEWALCPDTEEYPEEDLCKSPCSVRQKLLELCYQIKRIVFQVPCVVAVNEHAIVLAAEVN